MLGGISHEEVLRYVYQFLDENGYHYALLALQTESRVAYNVIHVGDASHRRHPKCPSPSIPSKTERPRVALSPANLASAVVAGQWDRVLADYVDRLLLPQDLLFNLYELVFEELLHLHGLEHAARAFLANSPVFRTMKHVAAARHVRLQTELSGFVPTHTTSGDPGITPAIPARFMEQRRSLAESLSGAIRWIRAPPHETSEDHAPGSLAALLYAGLQGSVECDRGSSGRKRPRTASAEVPDELHSRSQKTVARPDDGCAIIGAESQQGRDRLLRQLVAAPHSIERKIVYDAEKVVCACRMTGLGVSGSPDPQLLVGRADGVLDFVSWASFTTAGNSVAHTAGVLTMAIDEPGAAAKSEGGLPVDSDAPAWVAVGYRDGWVKVYNVATRKLVRRFGQVHSQGVTGVVFTGSAVTSLGGHKELLVSGSYDGAVLLLGIQEGAVLQRFDNAHDGQYVNSIAAITTAGLERPVVVTAGNDGLLCVWTLEDAGKGKVLALAGGSGSPLQVLHSQLRGETPTVLEALGPALPSELLVVTRGKQACVVTLRCMAVVSTDSPDASVFAAPRPSPMRWLVRRVMVAEKPLRAGCARAFLGGNGEADASHAVVSVLLTDEDGTILLYNAELHHDAATIGAKATGRSGVVVADAGAAVDGLRIQLSWNNDRRLICYSPQLPALYVLGM